MAAFSSVNGANGNPGKLETAAHTLHNHLDLKREALLRAAQARFHQPPANQTVSTLIVMNSLPGCPGEQARTEGVAEPAHPGHARKIPPADNQIRPCFLMSLQKQGDFGRVVLAVRVEGHHHLEAVAESVLDSGLDRAAVAEAKRERGDQGSTFARHRGGGVGGRIVHDEHHA